MFYRGPVVEIIPYLGRDRLTKLHALQHAELEVVVGEVAVAVVCACGEAGLLLAGRSSATVPRTTDKKSQNREFRTVPVPGSVGRSVASSISRRPLPRRSGQGGKT